MHFSHSALFRRNRHSSIFVTLRLIMHHLFHILSLKYLEFFYDKLQKHVTFFEKKRDVSQSLFLFILYTLNNVQYTRVHSTSPLFSFILVTQFCSSALRTLLYYLFITLLRHVYVYAYVYFHRLMA